MVWNRATMTMMRSPHLAITNQVRIKQPQQSTPPRITSNVKTSLKLLGLLKELGSDANRQSKPSTSYRRKKVDKKSLPDYDLDSLEDPGTKTIEEDGKITIVQPVLLVDGYNICGAWPKLKKHFAKGELLMARVKLIDELINYSAARGMKVVVVFDAMESGLPSHREMRGSVDIVFSADSCADAWIEREVYLLRDDGCPKVRVVTSDSLHQQVANGMGASVWSCKGLIGQINEVKKELEQIMNSDWPYSMEGKLLEHNLAPEAFNSLKALKQRLKQSPSL